MNNNEDAYSLMNRGTVDVSLAAKNVFAFDDGNYQDKFD